MTAISIAPTALLGRERRLELETTGDPDVLLRVMVVLRRRGFTVRAVEFRAGDHHAPPRLHMTVASASARPAALSPRAAAPANAAQARPIRADTRPHTTIVTPTMTPEVKPSRSITA